MQHQALSLKNLSVQAKLFGGFSIIIAFMIVSSIISIQQSGTIRDHALKGKLISDINADINSARISRLNYQLHHDENALQENKTALQKMDEKVLTGENLVWEKDTRILFNSLRTTIPSYTSTRDTYINREQLAVETRQGLTAPDLKSALDKYSLKLASLEQVSSQQVILLNALNSLWSDVLLIQSSNGQSGWAKFNADQRSTVSFLSATPLTLPAADINDAQDFLTKLQGNIKAYEDARMAAEEAASHLTELAGKLNNITADLVTSQTQRNLRIIQQMEVIVVIVPIIAVVSGLLVAWLISRQMTYQIRHNLALAELIAQGDLTTVIEPHSTDEIGRLTMAMATMNSRLRSMISQIRNTVMHVASASSEISAGNTDLASRTEEQSAAVVETAASMEQLISTVKRNAENAHEARKLAVEAADHARSGGEIVCHVVSTMNAISESSKKITDIISVINGISFQTNILALNAAVEAARAGEQGRAFAVVAGEVRNLAQRSAQAAKEIEGLIQESVERVQTGTEMANKAGSTMELIVSSVTNVSGIMHEISDASEEQSQGIEQIGKAVTELDSTTQQNAALVEESSAASSSLEQQAEQLAGLVSVFRLDDNPESEPHSKRAGWPASFPQLPQSAQNGNWHSF